MTTHENVPQPDDQGNTGNPSDSELERIFRLLANGQAPQDASFDLHFPMTPWQWWNPYLNAPGLPSGLPSGLLPAGEYTIRFSSGTGTNANADQLPVANSDITFRISQESLDHLGVEGYDAAQLGQLAEDILRSLDHLNPPQMQEMLAPAAPSAPKPTKTTAKTAQNSAEKPVKWKKTERNRLKFYRWLAEQGNFESDIRPTHTFLITDVLRDVAETDTYVPPVPRVSDERE